MAEATVRTRADEAATGRTSDRFGDNETQDKDKLGHRARKRGTTTAQHLGPAHFLSKIIQVQVQADRTPAASGERLLTLAAIYRLSSTSPEQLEETQHHAASPPAATTRINQSSALQSDGQSTDKPALILHVQMSTAQSFNLRTRTHVERPPDIRRRVPQTTASPDDVVGS
ncbi:Hypothetical protein SMAX5B_016166, partial [Scophthalmus maximus]